jgi:uncharacterized membrane protein
MARTLGEAWEIPAWAAPLAGVVGAVTVSRKVLLIQALPAAAALLLLLFV